MKNGTTRRARTYGKWATLLMVVASILLVTACGNTETGKETAKVMKWDQMPAMEIDPDKNYMAEVKTNKGSFEIELFANEAPQTVNNFVFLARQGFYEGITFHRIIETFMVQTGDPNGDGTGGPGYTIPDELDSERQYEAGIVAMAKTMEPNSAGSQFFICTGADAMSLNASPDYPIFGKVKSGMDVVEAIASTPVEVNSMTGEYSQPSETVQIESIVIHES